jgi:predicted butyrate kinase (DUF1464 family)
MPAARTSPRVIGIDPGTISIDLCGLADGNVWLDRTVPTRDALADPAAFIALLTEQGVPDLIAGPSGYGLPLIKAQEVTEADLRLALLSADGEAGGIGGLGALMRLLSRSSLPIIFTPGVIHLATVPAHRKLNRVDLGTADKVGVTALAIWAARRLGGSASVAEPPSRVAAEPSFILLELGGAFSAAIAVEQGAIVDGIGGTSGPMGWQSSGGWDGEVAFLAGSVTKELLFRGGATADPVLGYEAYIESACKAVLSLTASVVQPERIFLSGRHATDSTIRSELERRLGAIAPLTDLRGFAQVAKQGAQGAALIADGLAGGECRRLVEGMRLQESSGSVLDWLRVISTSDARRRLGITGAD